ncbi:phosphotransferase [Embleya sp. NBC_00896]|uniref:phosphotransferase n=1 Tax=Embleya sp. NBC_00896 TaxID=2975961 RepID=UPI00386C6006|nr:phosphotransferase [Embleya sp. NBC_00896]
MSGTPAARASDARSLGAAVESFAVEDVSSGTSSRWRVAVTYNAAGTEAGLPVQLFAKTTCSASQRLLLGLVDLLRGEPGFYRSLRPALDIEAPIGYHGAADLASGRSIVLVEDVVATKGATFRAPRTPLTRPEIEDLLTGMAQWHGRYWEHPDLARHDWLRPPSGFVVALDRFAGMRKRGQVGVERARAVIPDKVVALHGRLYEALWRSMAAADRGPATLLHGDPHIGNVYTTAAGRMGFCDWQVVSRGNWAHDVSYLVVSTLAVADRRAWERDLLALYLDRLAETGAKAPDFDAAWLAYRRQLVYPYLTWLLVIGRSAVQPRFQADDVSLGVIERTAHAVADLDPLAAVEE